MIRRLEVSVRKLEKGLFEHCAPTLAGIKCAGLFNYYHDGESLVREEVQEINRLINEKGVYVEVLKMRTDSALIYIYRPAMLEEALGKSGVFDLLLKYGYKSCDADYCIKRLKSKFISSSCFPHEIGIFLGYPLEDVKGFIENAGRNCECCGAWKVYCNSEEKVKLFAQIKKCKDVYTKLFFEGVGISKMTVCT